MATKNYISIFSTTSGYEAAYSGGELDLPNVSLTEDNMVVHYNPYVHLNSDDYLTFVAKESGTFRFDSSDTIQYSDDNGSTWTNGNEVTVNNGDNILWKGNITPSGSPIGRFYSTALFDVQGNIMSLIYGDNFRGQLDLTGMNYVFKELFCYIDKLINAENLSLPATTLALQCYTSMFDSCTQLITAPELPATTLANDCYSSMFKYCESLTTAPSILPATTLTENCYSQMFYYCPLLTTAPVLPATTLVDNCYYSMFSDCMSLNYIKAMFLTVPNESYTSIWVSGVSSTGTFVKNSAATWNYVGDYSIPEGWTVETASA